MVRFDLQAIRDHAVRLAAENAQSEPTVTDIYWFPAEDEIRLIEIDPSTVVSDHIAPFYFRESPVDGIPVPSGIAVIRPEEKDTLAPPDEWGTWDVAERIWSRS